MLKMLFLTRNEIGMNDLTRVNIILDKKIKVAV